MIRNEKEYKTATKSLEKEAKRIVSEKVRLKKIGLSEEQIKNLIAPIQSFHDQFQQELYEFEKLKRGDIGTFSNFSSCGKMLIALRVSKGVTQKELAKRLSVDETQVSRDERNEYHGAAPKKLDKVLNALGAEIKVEVIMNKDDTFNDSQIAKA